MRASVVIRSKDEADRLRLTLTSLAHQTEAAQVVVVNDGSSDHTRDVIAEMQGQMDLAPIHHDRPAGRSGAANAGARVATGEIVLFLDGDTLAAPDLVERHMEQHRRAANLVVRGETFHLRCTRSFQDPEAGTPMAGEEARVAKMSPNELARNRVTREQIRTDFASVDKRGQGGIYPGFGPRKLFEMEMDALMSEPENPVLWCAASGSNQSLSREAFIASRGFHPAITINEHRELALRLCIDGLRMAGCTGRTYHMTHRSGWRDPLHEHEWENIFYAEHPLPEVALMAVLWDSLSESTTLPEAARLHSLADLAAAAERCKGIVGRDAVRAAHLRFAQETA